MIKKIALSALIVATYANASTFVTDGNAIRHAVIAKNGTEKVFYISELDGAISSYTISGQKRWRKPAPQKAVSFEIVNADLNSDGKEELITASGSGTIDCWDISGKLLWRYRPEHLVRFNDVAVMKTDDTIRIFAGGNDKIIYVLNQNGELIESVPVSGAIRKLEIGDFQKADEPLLFLMTMSHDKANWKSFQFRNPLKPAEVVKSGGTETSKLTRGITTDLRVQDVDQDGLDDLLIGINETIKVVALNGNFEPIASFDVSKVDGIKRNYKQRYAHTTAISLKPHRDEILVQFGRAFYLLNSKGEFIDWSGNTSARFPFSTFVFDEESGRFFGAGSVGGDNGIYEFDLTKDDWWKDHIEPIGRLKEVTANLENLYDRVVAFTPPEYQKPSTKPWVMGYGGEIPPEVAAKDFNEVIYIKQQIWSEDYDRSDIIAVIGEEFGNKRDSRKSYNSTAAELIAEAKAFEASNTAFTIWAGHGSDPFYVSIDTLEDILEAAPTTCHGFIYAEMASTTDPRTGYFIDHYLPRLAVACRKSGIAKLQFRYKQTFWATTVYEEPWDELFLSGKYGDILIPATEDTNSITQDMNLAGRIGLFASGIVDDYGMRLIDDNPTGWRPLAPCRQKTISPYLRSGILRAAYGARYGINWSFQGENGPGLELLMAMMGSGVLPMIEDPKQIASIGSWLLINNIPADFQERQHSGHDIDIYDEQDIDAVFATTQTYWGGVATPDHDYSKIALGTEYRWLNFVPKLNKGMVPIAPSSCRASLKDAGVPFTISNAKSGIIDNKIVPAKEFASKLETSTSVGAKKLLMSVEGASWSAIWIDETHLRLILLDPHYTDPRSCKVAVNFQHFAPDSAVDILSNKKVSIVNGVCDLIVPAGSVRFIDFTYGTADFDSDGQTNQAEEVAGTDQNDSTDNFKISEVIGNKIRFYSAKNRTYTLLGTNDIRSNQWDEILTGIPGTGGFCIVELPADNKQNFYKIKVEKVVR